eukprot:5543154-Pyramimonas_sp.AAC.1
MSHIPMKKLPKYCFAKARGYEGATLFEVLKSQEWLSASIQDRQNATVILIRGVGLPRTMLWHAV